MSRCFALIPCAGRGHRVCHDIDALPKQYWLINGKPMLWYALATLSCHPQINSTTLVLAPNDDYFDKQFGLYRSELGWGLPECRWQVCHCGGMTRQESVMNGLAFLAQTEMIRDDDWILVHDAARPGITAAMLSQLINAVSHHDVGGILALPLADTLKRATTRQYTQYLEDVSRVSCGMPYAIKADSAYQTDRGNARSETDKVVPMKENWSQMNEIDETLTRDDLWQAQTPQIFRFGLLQTAMKQVQERGEMVTDEASAIEKMGLKPLLIPGSLRNLKVTYAQDLAFVQALMSVEIV